MANVLYMGAEKAARSAAKGAAGSSVLMHYTVSSVGVKHLFEEARAAGKKILLDGVAEFSADTLAAVESEIQKGGVDVVGWSADCPCGQDQARCTCTRSGIERWQARIPKSLLSKFRIVRASPKRTDVGTNSRSTDAVVNNALKYARSRVAKNDAAKDNALFTLKGYRIPAEQLGKGDGYVFYLDRGRKYGVPKDMARTVKDAGFTVVKNSDAGNCNSCSHGCKGHRCDLGLSTRMAMNSGRPCRAWRADSLTRAVRKVANAVAENMSAERIISSIEWMLGSSNRRDHDEAAAELDNYRDLIISRIGRSAYDEMYRRANNKAV